MAKGNSVKVKCRIEVETKGGVKAVREVELPQAKIGQKGTLFGFGRQDFGIWFLGAMTGIREELSGQVEEPEVDKSERDIVKADQPRQEAP